MPRITVAFASDRHARDAVRFLGAAGIAIGSGVRGGSGSDCALVDIEIEAVNRERLATLLEGTHGFVVQEPEALAAARPVAGAA